ncbi:glycoside hydrolase, partial [Planctomycetota bacterium]
MKERYQYLYYDPQFRLPLYEVVFHDSVVTTHQWANGSLK